MPKLLPLIIGLLVFSSACDSPPRTVATMPDADGPPLRLQSPDAAFRMSAADRAVLREGIDPEALERFLGMVHPRYRARILATFTAKRAGEGVVLFNRVPDPVLQRALDEVWAPRQKLLTPEVQARAERNLTVRSEPFSILLVSEFPGDARRGRALVVHAGPGRDQVVLLDAVATPSLLVAASERLMQSRMEHGLSPGTERRFELTEDDDSNGGLPSMYFPRQQAVLDHLRALPPQEVQGLGRVRRTEFQVLRSHAFEKNSL